MTSQVTLYDTQHTYSAAGGFWGERGEGRNKAGRGEAEQKDGEEGRTGKQIASLRVAGAPNSRDPQQFIAAQQQQVANREGLVIRLSSCCCRHDKQHHAAERGFRGFSLLPPHSLLLATHSLLLTSSLSHSLTHAHR